MLKGTVEEVRKDGVAAQVQVDIGAGNGVTSTITTGSASRPGLEKGRAVIVVVKTGDVILAVAE